MPTWNADLYLKFAQERTRPAYDLAGRIAVPNPRRIIDLGCGPGTSTEVLAGRWPDAAISGMDSSPAMIAAARRDYPAQDWAIADIAEWAAAIDGAYDLVFSNAAMQWLQNHSKLYPDIFGHVAAGGAMAVQVPAHYNSTAQRVMHDVAASQTWRDKMPAGGARTWFIHEPAFYYDLLAPLAARVDIWETEYLQVMDSVDDIVEWYKGTGLRPYLDALPSDTDRDRFLADYREAIAPHYPVRADGRVLFPFERLFLIAYKAA